MKRILVTGANGQLGQVVRDLSAQYPQFQFLFTDIAELDICDAQSVETYISTHKINWVLNCAAYTAVDRAEQEEALCDKINHIAPAYLAHAIEKAGGRMIHISTDYVFNGTAHIPYTEETPTAPIAVYGRTKRAGETALLEACPAAIILRTAWLYSVYGNNFVKTMLRLGREKTELGVIFDQIGTPTYANDLAKVMLACIVQDIPAGIYHFSNEGVCSWYDFTKEIHRQAGITTCNVKPLHTVDYPTPAQRPHYSVLDKTKIKQTLGITIPHWTESLQECICLLEKATTK
ncbi:MAG: dTDP-4-dehydrorhamnose reductase [Phocaeicola sp.]|nr:dTDP-4-dehydrorhamnose reductase [Phocaeicola sp.]MDD7449106.1 dTDP-4-dehydrorhamnose reductase [Prevotellaceae bacterium]MDY5939506.1 dTDP-4-dehydrorhamnose reductase [Phocaeicola sp.]